MWTYLFLNAIYEDAVTCFLFALLKNKFSLVPVEETCFVDIRNVQGICVIVEVSTLVKTMFHMLFIKNYLLFFNLKHEIIFTVFHLDIIMTQAQEIEWY